MLKRIRGMFKRIIIGCFGTKKKEVEALNIPKKKYIFDSNTETFNCLICTDITPIDYLFQPYKFTDNPTITTTCSHPFCIDCISKHIAAKVQQNITVIECPDVHCRKEIEFDRCINIIPKLVMDRWEERLSNSLILSSTSLYCPYKDCSAALLEAKESSCGNKPGDEQPTKEKAKCPHCERNICTKCRVAWHIGMRCEVFQKLDDNEKAHEDVMLKNLARKKRWVRCPNCKFYIERIGGCSKLTCRCRHAICYDCGLSVRNNRCRCNTLL